MDTSNIPEFLKSARFWFSFANAVIIFLPRFGIALNGTEIAAINMVIGAAFNVVPPVNAFVAARRFEAKARAALTTGRTSDGKPND